jgi:hypothetical protein
MAGKSKKDEAQVGGDGLVEQVALLREGLDLFGVTLLAKLDELIASTERLVLLQSNPVRAVNAADIARVNTAEYPIVFTGEQMQAAADKLNAEASKPKPTRKEVAEAKVEAKVAPTPPPGAVTAKVEKPDITKDVLKATVTEYMERFGTNEALAVNEKFGGAKRLSDIPEAKYAAVHDAMRAKLSLDAVAASAEPKAEEPKPTAGVEKEVMQAAAKAFLGKYGDPAFRELLRKFVPKGAEPKLSLVDPTKHTALHEALANA